MALEPTFPPLATASVFLFCFRPCATAARLQALYESWLDPDEAARAGRFRFDMHRLEYLHGRALTRFVLARYLGVDPAAVRFTATEHGKPRIAGGEPVQFNLSHSRGTSVLAVSGRGQLGVDVEHLDSPHDGLEIAERYFSRAECDSLRRLSAAERQSTFVSLWALKESFIKATGRGMALPLAAFSYEIRGANLRLTPPADSSAAGPWHSELVRLGEGQVCAWTSSGDDAAPVSRFFDVVPGASLMPVQPTAIARGGSVTPRRSLQPHT
jgi:4'-phosphopantetheinyl transferase